MEGNIPTVAMVTCSNSANTDIQRCVDDIVQYYTVCVICMLTVLQPIWQYCTVTVAYMLETYCYVCVVIQAPYITDL